MILMAFTQVGPGSRRVRKLFTPSHWYCIRPRTQPPIDGQDSDIVDIAG